MNTVQKFSEVAGRIFLAAIFLIAGLGKIGAYGGTAASVALGRSARSASANGAGALSLDRRLADKASAIDGNHRRPS